MMIRRDSKYYSIRMACTRRLRFALYSSLYSVLLMPSTPPGLLASITLVNTYPRQLPRYVLSK